jgi:hypothetical protein
MGPGDDWTFVVDAMLPVPDALMRLGAGAILPGEVPGAAPAVTSGAATAPFGAGAEAPALAGALLMADIGVLDGVGAILPGEPVGETCGALTAPVGAGEGVWLLCAQAMPVVSNKAVDANHNVRIVVSCFYRDWIDLPKSGCR